MDQKRAEMGYISNILMEMDRNFKSSHFWDRKWAQIDRKWPEMEKK